MEEDDALRRKRDFFAQLDRLDDEYDESAALQLSDPPTTKVNTTNAPKRKRALSAQPSKQTTQSSSGLAVSRSHLESLCSIEDMVRSQDVGQPATPVARLSNVASNDELQNSSNSLSTSVGWSTPDISSRQLSDPKTLFAGLKFYFFPPNDIDGARRFRIRKAREAGAIWAKSWTADITHVIFDNQLTYQDLLKFLKVESLPSSIAYVNEDYPAICTKGARIFDHRQFAFHVKGLPKQQVDVAAKDDATKVALPASSPAIKKPKGGQIIVPSETSPSSSSLQSRDQVGHATEAPENAIQPSGAGARSKLDSDSRAPSEDDFAAVVREVQATKNLPLDPDDDDPATNNDNGEFAYDSDEVERSMQPSKKRKKTFINDAAWRRPAACVKDISIEANPNKHTIQVLGEMADWYAKTQDEWRVRAYRKAIGTLKMQDKLIATKDDAFELPFVGQRLAMKIEEIVWTGRLQRLENAKMEPADKALQTFLQIYGVGYTQASRWVQSGHRCIQDLLDRDVKLTDNQKVGIEHYQDFLTRIPRPEVAQIGDFVKTELVAIDPKYQTIVGGSYRRGASSSGDVDILITKPGESLNVMRDVLVNQLVPRLFSMGFLTQALSVTKAMDGTKWHGACQLPATAVTNHPGVWRRIDLLLVPWEEMGAALIYFTGNDIFNRSIRLRARRRGLRLNQRGLYKNILRQGIEKLTEGELMESSDEKRIFALLDVPWQEPWERDRY